MYYIMEVSSVFLKHNCTESKINHIILLLSSVDYISYVGFLSLFFSFVFNNSLLVVLIRILKLQYNFIGRYVPLPTTLPPYYYDRTTTSNWAILLYPEPTKGSVETYEPPSMLPIPPEDEIETEDTTLDSDSTYVNFDEKWNVEEEEVEVEKPEEHVKLTKEMPATMVLVIGIILGAFVAMVLIVIIGNLYVFEVPIEVCFPLCENFRVGLVPFLNLWEVARIIEFESLKKRHNHATSLPILELNLTLLCDLFISYEFASWSLFDFFFV